MNDINFRHRGGIARPAPADRPSADDAGPPAGRSARRVLIVTQYLRNIARRRKWVILGAVAGALPIGLL